MKRRWDRFVLHPMTWLVTGSVALSFAIHLKSAWDLVHAVIAFAFAVMTGAFRAEVVEYCNREEEDDESDC